MSQMDKPTKISLKKKNNALLGCAVRQSFEIKPT